MQNQFSAVAWALGLLGFAGAPAALAQKPVTAAHAQHRAQAAPAIPALDIQDAWVRATVPGQKVAAAYMRLQAQELGLQLQGLRSPSASRVQLHDMQMQGDVMHMVEVKHLNLPKGQVLQLASGGKHIMLMGLSQPLLAGSSVQLELLFQHGRSVTISVPVLSAAPAAGAATGHAGHHADQGGHGH